MTESVLSEMYGIPVEVANLEGHRVVVARRNGQTLPVSDV
jgi:hypothetical protein